MVKVKARVFLLCTGLSLLIFTYDIQAQNNPQLQKCFPADQLPSHITQLTDFGQRSEWSLDGQQVYFISEAGGEV